MKKYLFFFVFISIAVVGIAQPKPKPKEKPPTKKEMADMMKDMKEAMDGMSSEDKKMLDSMGVKMPDMKSLQKTVSGLSDGQIKKAVEDEDRIVPQKDDARINSALATTLSNVSMGSYINKTQQTVLDKLSPSVKARGAEIYQQIKVAKKSAANTAIGLWINGNPMLALYIMGEACKADPSNTIAQNNYAAFLTMCGAEQLALPILNNLNKRYPKNSSILNNITQAWFGLGDIARAEKYADSTIRIYAYHPQANMTKCLIEESKGNIPAAIAAVKKSIRKAYSTEKADKLKKLGYQLKPSDIDWDRPMPQDALGLGKFSWPKYPSNVEESKPLEKVWDVFKTECQQKIDELKIKQSKLEEEFTTQHDLRTKAILQAGQKGQYVQLIPGYAPKAIKKLGPGVSDIVANLNYVFANELEQIMRALTTVEEYNTILSKKEEQLKAKYKDRFGEGKENPFEAACKDENEIRNEFLKNANGTIQGAYSQYLSYVRRRTNDLLYYRQYTMWPEEFELTKVIAQISWLTQISGQRVFFENKSAWCKEVVAIEKKKNALQNFDDVHCDYVSTLNLGCYKITSACSNLIGEFDCGGVEMNVKKNVESGRLSGSAVVGTGKGIDGPAGAELEATIAALVEWDNTGITDVGAIAGVEAKAGGVTVAGAEAKVTVNSGSSISGKGILQGVNK